MKKPLLFLVMSFALATGLLACSAPHHPLKVQATPGQVQKPNGCVMEAGYCKPVNT